MIYLDANEMEIQQRMAAEGLARLQGVVPGLGLEEVCEATPGLGHQDCAAYEKLLRCGVVDWVELATMSEERFVQLMELLPRKPLPCSVEQMADRHLLGPGHRVSIFQLRLGAVLWLRRLRMRPAVGRIGRHGCRAWMLYSPY